MDIQFDEFSVVIALICKWIVSLCPFVQRPYQNRLAWELLVKSPKYGDDWCLTSYMSNVIWIYNYNMSIYRHSQMTSGVSIYWHKRESTDASSSIYELAPYMGLMCLAPYRLAPCMVWIIWCNHGVHKVRLSAALVCDSDSSWHLSDVMMSQLC